jgi:NTE family protein
LVVTPLRDLAGKTLDTRNVILGSLLPGEISEWVSSSLQRHLFGDATLQDLPDAPRFVINATNVQSMALWRFSKPYMADYRVGLIPKPTLLLAKAVTASAAFPPLLSPVSLKVKPTDFKPRSGMDLQTEPYTTKVILTDGGVYDNLGLETAWKLYRTILVSDGGSKAAAEPEPSEDWIRHGLRIVQIIDNQVRSLRYRQLIHSYKSTTDPHKGAYWGIRTPIAEYRLKGALPCPEARTAELAHIPTRLQELSAAHQERLINWGYAACDASLRAFFKPAPKKPRGFPYPRRKV